MRSVNSNQHSNDYWMERARWLGSSIHWVFGVVVVGWRSNFNPEYIRYQSRPRSYGSRGNLRVQVEEHNIGVSVLEPCTGFDALLASVFMRSGDIICAFSPWKNIDTHYRMLAKRTILCSLVTEDAESYQTFGSFSWGPMLAQISACLTEFT